MSRRRNSPLVWWWRPPVAAATEGDAVPKLRARCSEISKAWDQEGADRETKKNKQSNKQSNKQTNKQTDEKDGTKEQAEEGRKGNAVPKTRSHCSPSRKKQKQKERNEKSRRKLQMPAVLLFWTATGEGKFRTQNFSSKIYSLRRTCVDWRRWGSCWKTPRQRYNSSLSGWARWKEIMMMTVVMMITMTALSSHLHPFSSSALPSLACVDWRRWSSCWKTPMQRYNSSLSGGARWDSRMDTTTGITTTRAPNKKKAKRERKAKEAKE